MSDQDPVPLFVCHANCCRSVMADYLYRDLTGARSLSAGVEAGTEINDRAAAMLACWGIDASGHRPTRLDPSHCERAGAILTMGPVYLARVIARFGRHLAAKCYLFANPYVVPESFDDNAFLVYDPSFEIRPPRELVREFEWFRRRVGEIHRSLSGEGEPMVPASRYLALLDAVEVG